MTSILLFLNINIFVKVDICIPPFKILKFKMYAIVSQLVKYLLNRPILLNQPQSKVGQSWLNSWHKIDRYATKWRTCIALLCATLTLSSPTNINCVLLPFHCKTNYVLIKYKRLINNFLLFLQPLGYGLRDLTTLPRVTDHPTYRDSINVLFNDFHSMLIPSLV